VEPKRLNKFISESGFCSRREADFFIEKGSVRINGKPAKLGDKVLPNDKVHVSGVLIKAKKADDFVLIAYHKPIGVVSTTEKSEPDNILNYVKYPKRIFPIGRLDKDSSGLIFLTSNGDIVNQILRSENHHEKEYHVLVTKQITEEFLKGMASGVPILGQRTKKCVVEKISTTKFKIILVQGLNRQIRRMCEYFGYEIKKLERVRIMNFTLKGISYGDWKELNELEKKSFTKFL
jgi:23S rRNA pseudouridine2604 synthase